MVEQYTVDWYEHHYFVESAYSPYMDFERHNKDFAVFIDKMHPKSVLDVGCAYGYIVSRCLAHSIPAVGLDVSDWCGQQSKSIIPGRYIKAAGWALPFKGKSFDVIYCQGVLEHIPEQYIEQLFAEFARVAERCYLGVSSNSPGTEHHICNHGIDWWYERMSRGILGKTGCSLDIETEWLEKL